MTTVVDTSAILALLYPEDAHNEPAAQQLQSATEAGKTAINHVVYAELAADSTFAAREDLDYFLDDTGIVVESLDADIAYRAGETFGSYLDRRGETLECPACGTETNFECPSCGTEITARQHIAADFLIGAHAESRDFLLTFDDGFYREYFEVDLWAGRE